MKENIIKNLLESNQEVVSHLDYEYPLNEKIRTLLRLEELFSYTNAMINNPNAWCARTSINLIIELINFFERGDKKHQLLSSTNLPSKLCFIFYINYLVH